MMLLIQCLQLLIRLLKRYAENAKSVSLQEGQTTTVSVPQKLEIKAESSQAKGSDEIAAFMGGLLVGILGGAVVSVLLAPKSGEDLSDDLAKYTSGMKDRIKGDIKTTQTETQRFISKTQHEIADRVQKLKDTRKAGNVARAKNREAKSMGSDTDITGY